MDRRNGTSRESRTFFSNFAMLQQLGKIFVFFAQWIPYILDETGWHEPLADKKVTYHIEIDGRLVLVENVPARVNVETGERYFAPDTVERLQQAVWGQCRPVRTVKTPVYEYGALA